MLEIRFVKLWAGQGMDEETGRKILFESAINPLKRPDSKK
jgi:hypothetical protein